MLRRRLQTGTGVVLACFITSHLVNHSAGLLSVEAMETLRGVIMPFWQNLPMSVVLYGSLGIHALLALITLYKKTTLRMPAWEAAQLVLGLLILPLLAAHLAGTRISAELIEFDITYEYVISAIWQKDRYLIQQSLLLLVVWTHTAIGLHFWLRMRPWYARGVPIFYALALLVPTLALLGFYRAGLSLAPLLDDPDALAKTFSPFLEANASIREFVLGLESRGLLVFSLALAATLLARGVRDRLRARRGAYRIHHPSGRTVVGHVGQSILDAIRAAGIPHASVCGGRGRCTTCRVRTGRGSDKLPPPTPLEGQALARITAAASVRLACQLKPTRDIWITPLLPPSVTAAEIYRPGGVAGHEQQVVAMFIDLRDSTKLGEQRLPYDVVFILNQFFSEMYAALEASGGHYAQFSGDGLLALYGLACPLEEACRQALRGAIEMQTRIDKLNERLADDLFQPLRIGIGVHCGEAIVGTMGPPRSPNLSAIGDNVNIAARLEAQTKIFGCPLIISELVATRARLDPSEFDAHSIDIRGRDAPIGVYAIADLGRLAALVSAPGGSR